MKRWTEYLEPDVYTRLCECHNVKEDLPKLVDARWRWIQDNGRLTFTREDALVYVLDWLDSNGQCNLADLTKEEYNKLKSEPLSEKEIKKRKDILAKFIDCMPADIKFCTGGHGYELYTYNDRFYTCQPIAGSTWGDSWYAKNQWRDIDGHRCSIGYFVTRNEREHTWTLFVGSKKMYTWKRKTTNYKPKTAVQVRRLALTYTEDMIRNCNDDYDPRVVFAVIENHFWSLFGRLFDGRNCKLYMNMEGN